jgi:hypothetical protein
LFTTATYWASIIALGKLGTAAGLRMTLPAFILPTMTLKNAALLALIGTILATVLLV